MEIQDLLKQIKDAEKERVQRINSAKEEAQRLLEETETKRKAIQEKNRRQIKNRLTTFEEELSRREKKERAVIEEKAEEELSALRSKADAHHAQAVNEYFQMFLKVVQEQ